MYPQSVLDSIKKTDLVTTSPFKVLKFDEAKILHKQEIGPKPWGLWYACGKKWLEWCQSEMPEMCHRHLFVLKVSEDVLKIRTQEELRKFNKKYKAVLSDRQDTSDRFAYIDWSRVTQEYPGIEICPYQYDERFKLFWYYSWDVASGCIWRADGLISAERIL